jgi:hypothetical protein
MVPASALSEREGPKDGPSNLQIESLPRQRTGLGYKTYEIVRDPFENHEWASIVHTSVVKRDNVGVLAEVNERSMFPLKAFLPSAVVVMQDLHALYCAESAFPGVERLVDS